MDTEKDLKIRSWKKEDADGICEIYSLITNQEVNADFRRVVLERAQHAGKQAHFVAELDEKIVGFLISYILPFGFGAEDCAYIATMGVHPKYMDQGIGAKMTEGGVHVLQGSGDRQCLVPRFAGILRICYPSLKIWDLSEVTI